MVGKHTFTKAERLCSQVVIDRLYAEGNRLFEFPFSVRWLCIDQSTHPTDTRCQVMMVVPKRKLHHAVDRNRMRRLMRECYRMEKDSLIDALQEKGMAVAVAIVYINHEKMDYGKVVTKMERLLARLQKEVVEHSANATI